MDWLTNEVLFYGGITIIGCSLLSAIIFLCASKIKAVRLNAQLDAEYGERKRNSIETVKQQISE